MFLRIPFPVGLQVSVGNKKCFASDLEGGSERVAVFLLPQGVCGAPALLLTAGPACEREAAPDLSPPLPPDLVHQFAVASQARGQLHQGMPGTCRVKVGAGERNAGSRLSTASVCPCSYPLPAASLTAPRHPAVPPAISAQPRASSVQRQPRPAHASAKGGAPDTLFSVTHRGSASLIELWWVLNDVLITSQRRCDSLYLEFAD